MKHSLLLIVGIALCFGSIAQNPDEILGLWLNQDKDAHVEITKRGNKYYGKVVWLKFPNEDDGTPKVDDENPDERLQSRPIKGLEIVKDLEWDTDDNEWDDGSIYDPKSGNTYSCYATIKEKDVLNLRGYIGFSLIGRTNVWTRVK
jgi:uncharacterized protein (DUF2147 family)